MKHNYTFLFILLFFISIFIGIKEVKANPVTTNDYNVVLLENDTDEVCTGLLGENLQKDLESILKIIRMAGPILVIFFTSMEFIVAIAGKDDDALKKCTKKLMTRLVLVVILFFLPILLNLLLSFLDQKYTTCVS